MRMLIHDAMGQFIALLPIRLNCVGSHIHLRGSTAARGVPIGAGGIWTAIKGSASLAKAACPLGATEAVDISVAKDALV